MRKGLPSKYAKMGFKKGWAAYKRGRSLCGSSKSKRGKLHHSYMLNGDFSIPALLQRPVSKISNITPSKIFSPIIDLGLLIVGMMLGAGIKKVSPIKNPHLMNGVQAVAGVGGSLLTRNRFVKMPLLGIALQSTIAETKLLMPKMLPLAGDDEVIYLPAGEGDIPAQIEFSGNDERVGAVIDGEDGYGVPAEITEVSGSDDERMGAVIDGEDDEMGGEGGND
jgi:hypothetical protein